MLNLLLPRGDVSAEPTPDPLDELLDGMGLGPGLPERLIQDLDGRPFAPAQIDQTADLVAHLALLLRREPVGGAEPQIREHEGRIRETLASGLTVAMARRSDTPRSLLTGMLGATRTRKAGLDAQCSELDQRYETMQTRLHHWQERVGQRNASLGRTLWRWVVGGADQLSLPEAVALWNDREYVALQRTAVSAAQACFGAAIESIVRLLTHLDARIDEARELALTLTQQYAQVAQPSALYAPWTLRLNEALIAATLVERADLDLALATLVRQLAAEDDASLKVRVQTVASEAAERLLADLTISDLVALEAEEAADLEDDGLVVIGQALLDAVAHPSWQLTRRARPRVETVQVTPDGTPIYSLEGLGSAAYGGGLDRMGFVQLQLDVALNELAVMAEGEEQFATTLAQRNLYVLDELAATTTSSLPGVLRPVPRPVVLTTTLTEAEV